MKQPSIHKRLFFICPTACHTFKKGGISIGMKDKGSIRRSVVTMELVRRPVRTYRTIETRETEELFENSIIVPDSKPDVKNILVTDAECFVLSCEKSGRMMEVSGEIRYRILYVSDTPERRVESIQTHFPWSVSCQKPKQEGETGVIARCRCQHTEANAVNGRKIIARSVTSLTCKFVEIKSDELSGEITGENVCIKNKPVNVVSLKDTMDTTAKVHQTLSLPNGSPAIKEILYSKVNMGNPDISYREDEASLEAKGTLNLLYRGEESDDSLESVVLEFPVKAPTGVQVSGDSLVFASTALKGWDVEAAEDADGLNTQVQVSMEVEVNSQAVRHEEMVLVDDAYGLDQNLLLAKAPVNLVADERELCENCDANARVRLDNENGRLDEIYMVSASNRAVASKISDKTLNIQGNVGVDAVYCADKKTMDTRGQTIELSFNHVFQLPDAGNWQVVEAGFSIEDVVFDMAGNEAMDLSVKMKVKARVCKIEEVNAIASVNTVKDEAPVAKAPVVMYFAQPGDTLWDIAKKYRIPVGRLAQDNGLDAQAAPETGKKMFIMS